MITCPKCGGALQVVALGPLSAPWLCPRCMRGFWVAELSPAARAKYRPRHDDWGLGPDQIGLATSIQAEIAAAVDRGTSLRADQFANAHLTVLSSVAGRGGLSTAFASELSTFITNAGSHP